MPKTLYRNKKNVDISSLLIQSGGAKKINKREKEDVEESSLNDSEYGNSENDLDDSDNESNGSDDSNLSDEGDDNQDIRDGDPEQEQDDEQDDEEMDEDDDNNSRLSGKDDSDESVSGEKNKDYIDNETTLKNKCFSKYARVDYEELDFDELFGDENFNLTKVNIKLTKPILTKYEFVRLLTDRTKQLAQGAKPMLKNISGLTSKEIAKLELKNKIIPLIIERPVPNSNIERWKLSELEIPEYLFSN